MIRLFTTGVLLFLAQWGQCQPALVTTRFLTYAPGDLPPGFKGFYQSGGRILPFRASSGTLGLPIEYTGPPTLVLRESPADFAPPPEGQAPKPPLAAVALPTGADNILLLCSTLAGGKIRLTAFDISSGNLKDGEYRVFNFAKSAVAVIFEETRFALKPRQDTLVRNSKWNEKPVAFPIQIATVEDGKTTLAFSSQWEHFPKRRNLFFLFEGDDSSTPIVFANFDAYFPPPEKPAAKTAAAGP